MYKRVMIVNISAAFALLCFVIAQIIIGHGTLVGIICASISATCLGIVVGNIIDVLYRMTRKL